MKNTFDCYQVNKNEQREITAGVELTSPDDLPTGTVTIRVVYSSINYKDALAATGHPGVVRNFPHVPGIDAAGVVVASEAEQFTVGQSVVVTSYELGVERWGAWSEFIRVQPEWIVPLPAGLTLKESMILGTAGLTAAMCVSSLLHHGINVDAGGILVTGASGGVGSFALSLLNQLGFSVTAVSSKVALQERLIDLGAKQVIAPTDVNTGSDKPLLKAQWAGAIDTVGGSLLSHLIRSIQPEGCVAACGNAGGTELDLTVFPFILRGVTLAGIDSAWYPIEKRTALWQKLATEWKLTDLDSRARVITLDQVATTVDSILKSSHQERTIIQIGEE
ncbi:MAG: YhdH/YhfP family quinone oxidoreductase [Planctomycetes bacterium]|nr:YhdH/YhfP family quinone oxidoreductase [Planctomycetota bacterium]MCH9726018.1 YhdH/YhfP family quinone oxidoreductase [Planctomycetota bacterium]MCH9777170.1 YhdH/YhfP family quinone oxidoreductase [Planctomycetota bacterium]MCH9790848.1 YhdH/YhfP family quinone oxidoreductase [Planctomycetota bacterium]